LSRLLLCQRLHANVIPFVKHRNHPSLIWPVIKTAIIEEPGLEVKVLVDKFATAEYTDAVTNKDDDADQACGKTARVCHRYVESIDNAEFTIHVGLIMGSNITQDWIGRKRRSYGANPLRRVP
jgi:hypothetical protein